MSIINYSHASELEQVHREEIQSRLCNQEPSLNSPQASPTTPTLSRKLLCKFCMTGHTRHTLIHTALPLLLSARCPKGPTSLKPVILQHQTSYLYCTPSRLTAGRALTLCPHCPLLGPDRGAPSLQGQSGPDFTLSSVGLQE